LLQPLGHLSAGTAGQGSRQGYWLPGADTSAEHGISGGQELADRRAEGVDGDEEGVMALWTGQRGETGIAAAATQAIGDLFLLLQRKQDVGFRAQHEGALRAQGGER